MKNLIVFAVLIAACYAQLDDVMQDPQSKECADQCSKDTGMNLSELMKKGNCLMKCLSTKAGFLNDKGDFNMDALKERFKMLDPSKLTEAANKCAADNKQEDLAEKMTATTKCFFGALGSPQ